MEHSRPVNAEKDAPAEPAAKNLTEAERNKLRLVFHAIDSNNDGLIDVTDIRRLLEKMHVDAEDKATSMLLAQEDRQDQPTVPAPLDFDTFCAAVEGRQSQIDVDIVGIIYAIDASRDGRLTVDETSRIMSKTWPALSQDDARKMLEAVDTEKDGYISLDDFVAMARQEQQHPKR